LVQWIKGRWAGYWFIGGCTEPSAMGKDVKDQAVEFARAVVGNGG
jgi:hypothetical protein